MNPKPFLKSNHLTLPFWVLNAADARVNGDDVDVDVDWAVTRADERFPPSNVDMARWAAEEDLPLATNAENMRGETR